MPPTVTAHLLTALQLVFLACVVVGVALLAGVGAALIVGGLLGALACEAIERHRDGTPR